jgi:single-stranded DNA-binding protein
MRCVVSGSLSKQPIEKTSKSGNSYLLVKIVEKNGEKKRWISAFIFDEAACEEVRRLGDGDPLAVAGEVEADVYTPDGGEPRINWTIVVDALISARRKPKSERETAPKRQRGATTFGSAHGAAQAPEFDDDIPF